VRPNLKNVTLCCIDTDHPKAGMLAVRRSMEQAYFGRRLFIGAARGSKRIVDPDMDCIFVEPFRGPEDYSNFVVKELAKLIKTDFVLIVHWDGWVVDGSRWTEDFLKFDYIGAPWPWHETNRVGNGGFSLRSRRLLEILAADPPEQCHPEDEIICNVIRPWLEGKGIKFADEDTAYRFAIENGSPRYATFGFHGAMNFDRYLSKGEKAIVLELAGKFS
jgi:Protein of unknown function (DUF5672)